MFCSKCSTPIPEGGLFCPKCGQKMTVSPPAAATAVPPVSLPQNQDVPAAPPQSPSPVRKLSPRREKRWQRRRQAKGFWFHPLTNLIILALSAAGWFFIPREITAYATGYDLSSLMAVSARLFQYNSLRDGWDAAKDAVLAILLSVLLIVLTLMGLAAVVRMFRRMIAVSRRKKEWKKEKKELLRKELSDESSGGSN